jgi:hypothetical protein
MSTPTSDAPHVALRLLPSGSDGRRLPPPLHRIDYPLIVQGERRKDFRLCPEPIVDLVAANAPALLIQFIGAPRYQIAKAAPRIAAVIRGRTAASRDGRLPPSAWCFGQ